MSPLVRLILTLTTEPGELGRAGVCWTALRAGSTLGVHLASDKVPVGPVVAGVEGGEPLPGPVAGGSAAHLVRVRPDGLGEVAGGAAELEGLHVVGVEELHLVVPVRHSLVPVILRPALGLLEDVEILANTKPGGRSGDVRQVSGHVLLSGDLC